MMLVLNWLMFKNVLDCVSSHYVFFVVPVTCEFAMVIPYQAAVQVVVFLLTEMPP